MAQQRVILAINGVSEVLWANLTHFVIQGGLVIISVAYLAHGCDYAFA
jgi:hypothetical protein